MKRVLPLILLSLFACGKKNEYDRQKVAVAIANHSFYKIDYSSANSLASDISALKKIDVNADIVSYKSRIVNKEKSDSRLYYPVIFYVEGGLLKAAKVFDFSVAYEAGLRSGCKILSVANRNSIEIIANPNYLVSMMNNSKPFQVEYVCGNEKGSVEIKEELAYVPFVWSFPLSEKSAYARIMTLSPQAATFIKNNLSNLRASGKKYLVLDLRWLSSGSYEEARGILNLFIDRGTLLFETISDKQGYSRKFEALKEKTFDNFQLIILINSSTAYLGEIMAASLKKNTGAVLVGQKTAGKADIIKMFKVGNGKAIRLTVAKFSLPGEDISAGVSPDYIVDDNTTSKTDRMKIPFLLNEDRCIMKALDIIRERDFTATK